MLLAHRQEKERTGDSILELRGALRHDTESMTACWHRKPSIDVFEINDRGQLKKMSNPQAIRVITNLGIWIM